MLALPVEGKSLQPFSQLGTLLALEVEARGGVPLGKSVLARVFREETHQ